MMLKQQNIFGDTGSLLFIGNIRNINKLSDKANKSLSRILRYIVSICVIRKAPTGAGLQGFRCLYLRTIADILSVIANNWNNICDYFLGSLSEIANPNKMQHAVNITIFKQSLFLS